ncbi:MAG TPA: YidC/Oxa1 family membrane protein insertase [Chloroflexota bacterium]|nr:YidC/Oxa1 family membrane protein insertase [Chloroflexota bacterium]
MLAAIGQLYNAMRDALAGPMYQALILLYHALGTVGIPSWGLTIVLFTILVKVVFWPLTAQQFKSSKAMQSIQPQLNELKKIHGKDKEKMMAEQMRLYKENRVNPMAGCLPMLIQFPIWIGLYQALYMLAGTVAGVAAQPGFDSPFLWVPNLARPEGFPYILAILTGISQLVVQRMMQVNATDPQQKTMNQAMQFMPIMYIFISFKMPAGLVLYWVASNVFSMIQQSFFYGWSSVLPTGVLAAFTGSAARPAVRERPGRRPPEVLNGTAATSEKVVPAPEAVNGRTTPTAVAAPSPAPRRAKKRRK